MFDYENIKSISGCDVSRGGPCGYVIFGASGDLAARKLIPSLFSLYESGRVPENFFVVGFGRTNNDNEKFRNYAEASILSRYNSVKKIKLENFLKRLFYVTGSYENPDSYIKLKECFDSAGKVFNTEGNGIFHLAVPPSAYSEICRGLSESNLAGKTVKTGFFRRVIIEKPYGNDLKSAAELQLQMEKFFEERDIYRIDHYMGKEAIQNILSFRFANSIFGPIWNKDMIDSVQITVSETDTVGHRAAFFDKTGLIRDMLQSHILLLSALIGMEAPVKGDDIRQGIKRFIESIGKIHFDENVIFGSYKGYEKEKGVNGNSCTETMFALKFLPKEGVLKGVPFYIRAGKAMDKKETKVTVVFRDNESCLMCGSEIKRQKNILSFGIHPKQEIALTFMAKSPGSKMCTMPVSMSFSYAENFGGEPVEDYANLILSCMEGDQTFFWHYKSIVAAWKAVDDLIRKWEACPADDRRKNMIKYEKGSSWPVQVDGLTAADGKKWE